jgi:chemotaxis protein MotA
LASPAAALKQTEPVIVRRPTIDVAMLAGVLIALAATVAGIVATGIKPAYFLQPTGVLIVLGGTLGVTFITTPHANLLHAARRVVEMIRIEETDRGALIDELLSYVKLARSRGILALDALTAQASSAFLREALETSLDADDKSALRGTLETKIRLRERHAETDAKVLEVAGGFAPTIGVIGTVVGLIDVLRGFSDVATVAAGIGAAFVSTIYGLGLANLVLLPAAHRIRARAAEQFDIQEMILEAVVAMAEGIHPSLVREKLNAFIRTK